MSGGTEVPELVVHALGKVKYGSLLWTHLDMESVETEKERF